MKQFLLVGTLSVLLFSCSKDMMRGSGPISSLTIDVAPFTGVETYHNFDTEITYGAIPSVKVAGYTNLLNILDPEVVNGVFKLKFKRHYNNIRNSNLKATVIMPAIRHAGIYGSGKMNITNFGMGGDISVAIFGSGQVRMDGSLYDRATLEINGSGHIRAEGMQASEATVTIHGSGHTFVAVSDKLTTRINGSGHVYYWGNPQVNAAVSGSGRVIQR